MKREVGERKKRGNGNDKRGEREETREGEMKREVSEGQKAR